MDDVRIQNQLLLCRTVTHWDCMYLQRYLNNSTEPQTLAIGRAALCSLIHKLQVLMIPLTKSLKQ